MFSRNVNFNGTQVFFNTESLDFKENFTVLVFFSLAWELREFYGGPYAHKFRSCSNSLCYPLPSVLLATVEGNITDKRLHLNHFDYSIQHESIMMKYMYMYMYMNIFSAHQVTIFQAKTTIMKGPSLV